MLAHAVNTRAIRQMTATSCFQWHRIDLMTTIPRQTGAPTYTVAGSGGISSKKECSMLYQRHVSYTFSRCY
jgi:hypothetical protein